jgi:ComF family protein
MAYLIQAVKFQKRLPMARLLGTLLARHLVQLPDLERPQAIIPVPLHPRRMRERGFNQALELARPVADQLGIPLLQCCRRVRDTPAQMTLDARQRSRNLKGAFACTSTPIPEHVTLVDDVMTTGHTLAELSHTLQQLGVKQVQAWICARAL